MAVDLSEFDDQAAPQGELKLEDMADGPYVLQVNKKATSFTSKAKGTKTVKIPVLVISSPAGSELNGGSTSLMRFVMDQSKFNELLIDFKTLGFDTENWKLAKNRPASTELEKAFIAMIGVRFRAEKRVTGTFHELVIKERVVNDGRPCPFTVDDLNAAASGVDNDDPFG